MYVCMYVCMYIIFQTLLYSTLLYATLRYATLLYSNEYTVTYHNMHYSIHIIICYNQYIMSYIYIYLRQY